MTQGKKMKSGIIMGHQHTPMKPTIRAGTNKLHLEYNAGPNKWGSDATMAERAEMLAAHLDIERKLQFYDNWARAVINGYFVFSDGSEIKVPSV